MPLSAAEVKNARPREQSYKLFDSLGLFLFVSHTGARSWRFKYRFAGKEKLLTFGLYDEVGLAEARSRRDDARAMLRDHKDPAVEAEVRKQAAIMAAGATFETVAREWHTDQTPLWSPGQAKLVLRALERDIFPGLGKMPVSMITGPMILRELRKVEKRGAIETAKRIRGYVVGVFKRAKGEHLVTANPATEIGDALKKNPIGSKRPALTTVPELLDLQLAVDRSTASGMTKLASRLLALTMVRVGVLRTATWDEFEGIDWDDPDAPAPDAVWRIAAERMKLEVEDKGNAAFGHDVHLSHQAVEVLRALRPLTGRYRYLFRHDRSTSLPMTDAAISTLYKRMAGGIYKGRHVPHGWRSAGSTLLNERAADLERDGDRMLIDLMLAHVPKGMSSSEYAYNRARYTKPMRKLWQAWADMISAGLPSPYSLSIGVAR